MKDKVRVIVEYDLSRVQGTHASESCRVPTQVIDTAGNSMESRTAYIGGTGRGRGRVRSSGRSRGMVKKGHEGFGRLCVCVRLGLGPSVFVVAGGHKASVRKLY